MADLAEIYAALKNADASGDTEGARKLADYLSSQPRHIAVNYDQTTAGIVPTGSESAKAAYSPVSDNSFLQNAAIGSGKFVTDVALGGQQIGGELSDRLLGTNYSQNLLQQGADKQAIDNPVMSTVGGRVGQILTGAVTGALIPGAGTYAGAAAMGAGYGALNPVAAGQSRFSNTGIGAGFGVAGKAFSDVLGAWIRNRSSMPVMGEPGLTAAQQEAAQQGADLGMQLTPGLKSGNRGQLQFESKLASQPASSGPFNRIDAANREVADKVAAKAIGIDAPNVDKTVLRSANKRFSQIFDAARSPENTLPIASGTTNTIDDIASSLNSSTAATLRNNSDVADLLSYSGKITNAQKLGSISSRIGKEANASMTSQGGDRELGLALYKVKDHVDELIGQSISDPALKATYNEALPQYRTFQTLLSGKIVNPSTGHVNTAALASRLQKYDRRGFTFGNNQSDLYKAAHFGQAFLPSVPNSGTSTRSMGLGNLAMQIPAYFVSRGYMGGLTGPLLRAPFKAAGAMSGLTSQLGAAVGPHILPGLPGGAATLAPDVQEYFSR
jgi:hypothetical protein